MCLLCEVELFLEKIHGLYVKLKPAQKMNLVMTSPGPVPLVASHCRRSGDRPLAQPENLKAHTVTPWTPVSHPHLLTHASHTA